MNGTDVNTGWAVKTLSISFNWLQVIAIPSSCLLVMLSKNVLIILTVEKTEKKHRKNHSTWLNIKIFHSRMFKLLSFKHEWKQLQIKFNHEICCSVTPQFHSRLPSVIQSIFWILLPCYRRQTTQRWNGVISSAQGNVARRLDGDCPMNRWLFTNNVGEFYVC